MVLIGDSGVGMDPFVLDTRRRNGRGLTLCVREIQLVEPIYSK